ncbi:GNAT family N-acetyltransferase [Flavicella sp.]|uniref:GNAT family N-acetyltransferase n=1 Tax=Flavicella sp. TaxID=2957742 RepID=UPI00301A97C1
MKEKLVFRKLKETDWEQVSKIYQEGLNTGNATFETNMPNWNDWNNGHLKNCRIIAELDNKIIGWSALSPVSSRCVYGGVAEVSVYVSSRFSRQKTGVKLIGKFDRGKLKQ